MERSAAEAAIASIATWMVAGAPLPRSFDDFMPEYANRLIQAELPIESLAFYSKHIHPMFPGNEVLWSRKRGVRRATFPHDQLAGLGYHETPFGLAIEGARVHRHLLEGAPTGPEPNVVQIYRKAGFTDLLVLPLFDVDGVVNKCMGYGMKAAGGFDEAQIRQLRRLQAPLARICQHYSDRSNIEVSLGTYLGRAIGRKILEGHIRRGQGETIPAVLLFVDIVGFTEKSNALPGEEVIGLLNAFFDVISDTVDANSGEILKFIGDGALVIFPVPDDLTAQESAAQEALRSVRMARERLDGKAGGARIDFRASLHIGEVFYGNVGSANRLDFTAIGPAVNLASRMLSEAGRLGAKTVCSAEFQEISSQEAISSSAVDLKGFDSPVQLFVID